MAITSDAAPDIQTAAVDEHSAVLPALLAAPTREMWLIVIASVLATAPVWLATYPPMVDLPEHAAQVALLRSLHTPDFRFAGLFWVNWFTPYLLGYMLVYVLTPLFGIVTSCKIVVALALAALPVTTALLTRETGADSYWALLTIPAMYGFSYNWGFLNFLVATPMGLLFLALFMRHTRKPSVRTTICLALVSILLFFSHALIYLFFGFIVCVFAMVEIGNLRRALLAVLPTVAAIPLIVLWYLRTKSDPGVQEGVFWDLNWITSLDPHTWGGRLTGFFPRLLGIWPSYVCLVLGIALFALPLLAGTRPMKRPSVWVPLAICLAVTLFAPTGGHSTWAVAQRFTVFALPFFVIGLGTGTSSRPTWRAAILPLLFAWISIIIVATLTFEAEAAGFNQLLSAMEPNQRTLSLMFMQATKASPAPVFVHYPAWYSATKQGVVDMNFAAFPVALVRYRPSLPPGDPSVSEWYPQTFRWSTWRGGAYRYFVVHAPVDLGYRLFGWVPCPVSLVTRSGNWWLYEKEPRCTSAQEQ